MTDEENWPPVPPQSPPPNWWVVVVIVAVALLVLGFLPGCAEIAAPDPVQSAQERDRLERMHASTMASIALFKSPEAQSSAAIVYMFTQHRPDSDYAHYAKAVADQNRVQGTFAGLAAGVVGKIGVLHEIGKLAGSGGDTSVNNTASGGSTAAGRNAFDDHSRPIDLTAGSIGSGDGSPTTLPQ